VMDMDNRYDNRDFFFDCRLGIRDDGEEGG